MTLPPNATSQQVTYALAAIAGVGHRAADRYRKGQRPRGSVGERLDMGARALGLAPTPNTPSTLPPLESEAA